MKAIIAGSRNFFDYDLLSQKLNPFIDHLEDVEIVSGTAAGADRLGERYAKEKGLKLKQFPADWNKYGKRAGYLRNVQMAEYADCLFAFWDGVSRGTKHMINLGREHGLCVRVFYF